AAARGGGVVTGSGGGGRPPDAGLQRRGSARRNGARRRFLCRCTILTRFRDEEPKAMAIPAMSHFTVLTDDVRRTVHFYCNLLGLSDGARPDLGFPGAWL